jgi:hypothetical protein
MTLGISAVLAAVFVWWSGGEANVRGVALNDHQLIVFAVFILGGLFVAAGAALRKRKPDPAEREGARAMHGSADNA